MTKLAFLFPGQGSQSVGMLAGLADSPAAQTVLSQANAALGEDLIELMQNGPAEQLGLTTNTQPAMLAAAYATYAAWLEAGGRIPDLLAGHSLGEYTALVAAQSLDLGDAIRTVRIRANAMQSAVPVGVGAMAAILGLEAAKVQAACAHANLEFTELGIVEAVNFNDPAQTVIAGHAAAVNKAIEHCKTAGAKRGLLLPVSAPFHSSLMKPAADKLETHLEGITFREPKISIINNIDVKTESEAAAIKAALVRQACGAVRWVETIQAMQAQGVTTIVECGPGKALAGMVKRIAPDMVVHNVFDAASIAAVKELL